MDEHQRYITGLKSRMIEKLKQEIPGVELSWRLR
jgi:hypothetical protein